MVVSGRIGIRVDLGDCGTEKSSLISTAATETFTESLIADSPSRRFLSRSCSCYGHQYFIKVMGEFECVIADFSFVLLLRIRGLLNEIVFEYYVVSFFFLELEIFSPFEEEKKF